MNRAQILTVVILVVMVALFLWEKWRFDIVALMALIASVAAGIVPANKAFSGFANPVLPLIGAALIVSTAIGQSGAIEILVRRLNPLMRSRDLQVGVLVACVVILSAFVKNIGALAIFIPAAVQVARRNNRSPSEFLMPLSFASLLGGSMTLVGTSPNILTASVRQQLTGQPFHMFDFTPVGAGIAVVGAVFLTFGWRLIPRGLRGSAGETAFKIEDYTSEARVSAGSSYIGQTVRQVEQHAGGEIAITAIIRDRTGRAVPSGSWRLYEDDVLVIEADPQALELAARDGKLELVGGEEPPPTVAGAAKPPAPPKSRGRAKTKAAAHKPATKTQARSDAEIEERRPERLAVVEAIVGIGSILIGHSASDLRLRERYGVNVLAVARGGRRTSARMRRARFRYGDALVVQGDAERIYEIVASIGCLPLAERELKLGRPRRLLLPLAILGVAMVVTGFEWVPVEIAFVAAALLLVLFRLLSLDEAYGAVDWPILILLGSLIPIGEAVKTTGTADLIAGALSGVAAHTPAFAVIGAVLAVTMLATPVLHHAAAVLVMGPIAASLAQRLGFNIDPFLMAVAVGAGSDFLSPIGHQSNTLVMGPGGYRFGDYWKLGLPLSILVVTLGTPLIMLVWPLH
ncbi:MAG TPA: SLC13 family permease [Stellaceae bacterium]|jgi:di/tricarboxylate transporter|nr:SLC13 family permease [Stellaceae bacterium]